MNKETFIFIGASGCGKGTQVALVKEELAKTDPTTPIFYVQTGQCFRDFVKGNSYAARTARETVEGGKLLPGFVAMWLWSDIFVKNLTGNEHLILDGSPRTKDEATHLDIAFKFFKRIRPKVIYIKVSRDWSLKRMLERATKESRSDDTEDSIQRRLSWFDRDVLPAIEMYRRDRDYDFFEINGEQSVEAVHRDIMANVFGV
ncbi:MAG: Adenylate kinase [Parcubacteria group bacterium GW2011_GWA2_47_7]|nr:MAG: Adenylate kinase [Parcubacteria group bacterium GW2011_GWA2_47_7]